MTLFEDIFGPDVLSGGNLSLFPSFTDTVWTKARGKEPDKSADSPLAALKRNYPRGVVQLFDAVPPSNPCFVTSGCIPFYPPRPTPSATTSNKKFLHPES